MEDNTDYNLKIDKQGLVKEILTWIVMIVGCLIMAKFINSFIIVNARVPSASMENTIMTNDRLMANRLAYTFSDPQLGDIIVFPAPDEPEKLYIKRVIGTPGDTVEIFDGMLYINDEPIDEPYLKEPMKIEEGPFNGPFVVPEGSYFMLGDNRNNSLDSRYWDHTYVPEDTILGKAMFTYHPKVHWIK